MPMTIIPLLFLSFILPSPIIGISISHPAGKHILKVHNEIRQLVAKGEFKINYNLSAESSSNMRKLVWDAKLAEKAQNYVNDNHPTEPRNVHGESMYLETRIENDPYESPYLAAVAAMNKWKYELSNITWSPDSVLCEDFKKIRNGLQMIRATTGSVGCALKRWKNGKETHQKEVQLVLVCMYDGDMATSAISEGKHEIYKVGKACSGCPIDSKCDEKSGLCVGSSESIPEDSSLATNILAYHNNERSLLAKGQTILNTVTCIAKPASNMRKLVWDNELAWAAEQYAKAKGTEKRWNGGENIFYEEGGDSTPENVVNNAMKSWFNEILLTRWSVRSPMTENHYIVMGNGLQMIWASSNRIGCGLHQWKSDDGSRNYTNFVCRYGPYFLEYDKKVYEVGEACANCDKETSCETNSGLCVEKVIEKSYPLPSDE